MSEPQQNRGQLNFNTFLNLSVGVMVGIIGWFGKETLTDIKANMMPRQELMVRMGSLEDKLNQSKIDITSVRAQLALLEIEVYKLKKQ